MTQNTVLYGMSFDPFWRRLKFGLLEKGVTCQDVLEKPWEPSAAALALNPTGDLPIFQDHHVVCDNEFVATEYIEDAYPMPSLMGKNPVQAVEIRRWIAWFDRTFYNDIYLTLFYERALKRHVEKRGPDTAIIKQGYGLLHTHLSRLDQLTDVRTYMDGLCFSWADITAASHLSCIDYLGDIRWDGYPALKEWYMKIKSRPTFRIFLNHAFPGMPASLWYRQLDF